MLLLRPRFRKCLYVGFVMIQWIERAWCSDTIATNKGSCVAPPQFTDTTTVPTTTTTSDPPALSNSHADERGKKNKSLRIMVVVEPSPITYMSGYTNRFRQLFLYLSKPHAYRNGAAAAADDDDDDDDDDDENGRDDVKIITTEVVKPNPPTTYLGFPVLYTRGFRLPHYPIISISWDWTFTVPRCLIRDRPDLIHVTSPGLFVGTTVLWARLLQIPIAVSYHTHLPVYVRSYLPPWLAVVAEPLVWVYLRFLYFLGDSTMVTSSVIQDEFRKHGMKDIAVWPKGIDTMRFHPKWATLEWRNRLSNNSPDACILLYVGRLAVEKRLGDLRAIIDRLPRHYRLAFVGQGPQEEELRALFADYCKNDDNERRVIFLGPLYDEDLCHAYASADIFVLPSDSETLGFVVMEAMASGVPVVAANAGGIPDMIQDGETGFLVPPGDIDVYVQAIETIGIDGAIRRKEMGHRGRALTESWSWNKSMRFVRHSIYMQTFVNFRRRWDQELWRFLTFQK